MNEIPTSFIIALFFVTIWQTFWRGIALWNAVKNHQKKWFIFILILTPSVLMPLNDFGLVPIVYLFFFSKHKLTLHDMSKWFTKKV